MSQLLSRLTEVSELLSQALDWPSDDRDRLLRQACKGDEWLFSETNRALQAEDDSHPDPGFAAVQALSASLLDQGPLDVDATIGNYRIIKPLGQGGMGAVYLAERADGLFEHQVALKVLLPWAGGNELRHRFEQERQILASLRHPAIARLLDGGITQNRRSYFVLEYIDGQPIDQYCDAHGLSIEEKLQLVRVVIDAVHYAHRNLVVHRDLKPSNILVTPEGQVKLLDFGIAKVLGNTLVPHLTLETRSFARVMTPEYASPEQFRGRRVTTSSDVYQLGVLLYELLSGCRPFDLGERSPSEIEDLICEQPTVPPSQAVGKGSRSEVRCADRSQHTAAKHLRRRLCGDLDTIILMAMRKAPDRRYSSAEQLGSDIEKHLAGRPISARRDNLGYRAKLFLRRHSLAAGFIISLVCLASAFSWQLAAESENARLEADKAREVSNYLRKVLEISDPEQLSGMEISVEDLLRLATERVTQDLHTDGDIRAEIMATLGDICRRRGLYNEAESLLEAAVSQQTARHGADTMDVATSTDALADLYSETARYDEAESLYQQSLEIQESQFGKDDLELAETLDGLGHLYAVRASYDEAMAFFQRALTIRENNLGPDHSDLAASLSNVAYMCMSSMSCSFTEAEGLFDRALQNTRKNLGPDHPQVSSILNRFAYLSRDQGRFVEADEMFRQALELRVMRFGLTHPEVLGSINNLADHSQRMGRFEEADQLFTRGMEVASTTFDTDHPTLAVFLNNICELRINLGRYDDAEGPCLRALEIRENTLRHDHPRLASSLRNLARLRLAEGDFDTAEEHLQRALKICEDFEKPGAQVTIRRDLGLVLLATERFDEAAQTFRQGIRSLVEQWTPQNQLGYRLTCMNASLHLGLGVAQLHLGSQSDAHVQWERALTILGSLGPQEEVVVYQDLMAQVLLRLGRSDESRPITERLFELGWSNPDLIDLADKHGLLTENPPE